MEGAARSPDRHGVVLHPLSIATIAMNVRRIFAITANVFREVIRDRVLYLVALYALFLVAMARLLPEVSGATEAKILPDVGLAAMQLLALVIAIFVGTGLVNKEIEKRTVLVMMAKPVSRIEFILGKYLGLSAVLAVLILLMTAIFWAVMAFNQIALPWDSILVANLFLFFQMSLMTAVAIAFSVFTGSLLATLLTFGVFLMGVSTTNLVELGKLSKNPAIETATRTLYLVLPDLARFDLKNQAVYGLMPDVGVLWSSVGYGVLYAVVLMAIAGLVFSAREF